LGIDMMLEGVKIGMLTMRVGEIAQFLFKPHLGFGDVGGPPRVPPNAEILAEIQVICMEQTDEPIDLMNHAELSQLPYADVWKYVENKLEQGKALFNRGKHGSACNRYRRARDLLESRVFVPDGFSKEERTAALGKLYRNLALCYLQLENPAAAVDNAELAFELNDRDAKALYLWAKAIFLQGDYHEALKLVEQAQKMASTKEIRDLILKIDAKIVEYENAAKAQAQKMLGISK